MLSIDSDFSHFLRSQKPTSVKIKQPLGVLGGESIQPLIIPPLNTDIRISDVLPQFSLSNFPHLGLMDTTNIPESFNWRENGGSVSANIAPPDNQMLCGACWAFATAGAVSDNFVVSGIQKTNPNLSPTYCLLCYPQMRCSGGNPGILLLDIANGGIAQNSCVDYSWCASNGACSGNPLQHFEAGQSTTQFLPQTCGCYFGSPNYKSLLYFTDLNPSSISIDDNTPQPQFEAMVKTHIMTKGPVIGSFLVFRNFMNGQFTQVNGGVYLENSIVQNGKITFDDSGSYVSPSNLAGAHAISIIGWGVEKNIVVDSKGTKANVPYWYCRNSWTTKWGDGGFFKMATYPFNQKSQFDKIVQMATPNGIQQCGGMAMFTVSKPPVLSDIPSLPPQTYPLLHDDTYYKNSDKPQPAPPQPTPFQVSFPKLSPEQTFMLILLVIFVLVFILKFVINKSDKKSGK